MSETLLSTIANLTHNPVNGYAKNIEDQRRHDSKKTAQKWKQAIHPKDKIDIDLVCRSVLNKTGYIHDTLEAVPRWFKPLWKEPGRVRNDSTKENEANTHAH